MNLATSPTDGLNQGGAIVTMGLNPVLTLLELLVLAGLAQVKVDVLDTGLAVVTYTVEGQFFRPDASTHHNDDAVRFVVPQHVVTGLDPQADPAIPLGGHTTFHEDEEGAEGPQHVVTGLDPQADPAAVFSPDDSTHHDDEAGPERVQHSVTGLDPQADPAQEFAAEESTYHEDDAAAPEDAQHAVTGLDPQADPQELFEPEESTSAEDD